jgi:hypothetical protein
MEEQLMCHFKIWGTIALVDIASYSLDEYNILANIIMKLAGAVASLSVAWFHIYKKSKK